MILEKVRGSDGILVRGVIGNCGVWSGVIGGGFGWERSFALVVVVEIGFGGRW